MTLRKKMKSEGLRIGMKAVGKIMESPERAEVVMKAVQGAQQAREILDAHSARILNSGQLPSRDDLKELERQAGSLRRRAKKIGALLDDIEEALDEDEKPE